MIRALVDELLKLGAISEEHAQHSLERLNTLERNRPTLGQVGRYGAIGAVAGPAIGALSNIIERKPPIESVRSLAASAVKGGLSASAIPLARAHFDRKAEIGTLKKYVAEREPAELEKGSAALKKPKKEHSNLKKYLGASAADVGLQGANAGLGHLAMKGRDAPFAGKEELFQKVRAGAQVPILERLEAESMGGGAFTRDPKAFGGPAAPHVAISPTMKSPAILAHELGHADIDKNRVGRLLQNKATISAGNLAPMLGGLGGFATGALTDNPTARRLSIAAPAIAAAPQLLFEAGATVAGLRHLHAAGANRSAMFNYLKTTAPAWGTYAARAGRGVAGAYGGQAAGAGLRNLVKGRKNDPAPTTLEKTSKPRAIREWRIAQNSGQEQVADEIAKGYGRLGLAPRQVEDISGGGMEASVDKMIGRASGSTPNESGYIARKLYKPDSPITIGHDTSTLLAQKQQYTDAARSLSPEAKSMVPAMYGHKTIEGPRGQLRHVSEHEFVPGATSMRKAPDAFDQVSKFQKAVTDPMASKGMPLADITRVKGTDLAGNFGNVASTPSGPKLIDFLPGGKGTPVTFSGEDAVASSGRLDTAFGRGQMKELRKEVFRPRGDYQPGITAVGKAAVTKAPALSRAAAPTVRPTVPAGALSRLAATVRPPGRAAATALSKSVPPPGVLGRIPQLRALHI